MKKIAYTFSFIVLSFVFVMAYYCCYYYATNNMKSDGIKTIYETMDENPALNDDMADANAVKEEIVSSETRYILETYNMETNTITKEELTVPVEYLGMDRQSMIDYLSDCNDSDVDDNTENIRLVSFSSACIVIRKSVKHEDKTEYNYWITEENGIVMVYKADKEELYLDTGIETIDLEKEDKKKLQNGFYLENIQELYNYLETITS
ncbi:MAG: hypothetical protein K2I03_10815 [Lachnospiraceae bacterium]|nr:hypothetical protein [Lachnospiraceae bacterium]